MSADTCPICLAVRGSVGCCQFKPNPAPKLYYFGCWGEPGHYLWTPHGGPTLRVGGHTPWSWAELDSGLCPAKLQIEGHAALRHKDGSTALAFWDRSGDSRPGSNSVFIAEGAYTAEEMGVLAREAFPRIWERFTFEVKVVQT